MRLMMTSERKTQDCATASLIVSKMVECLTIPLYVLNIQKAAALTATNRMESREKDRVDSKFTPTPLSII